MDWFVCVFFLVECPQKGNFKWFIKKKTHFQTSYFIHRKMNFRWAFMLKYFIAWTHIDVYLVCPVSLSIFNTYVFIILSNLFQFHSYFHAKTNILQFLNAFVAGIVSYYSCRLVVYNVFFIQNTILSHSKTSTILSKTLYYVLI